MPSMDDLNSLDKIIEHTIQSIEKSKHQIFEIAEGARREYNRLEEQLNNVRQETSQIIQEVDQTERLERQARFRLMEVHRDFKRYTEREVKEAYEHVSKIQSELSVLRERESSLRRRRDELELSLRNLKQTVERAEGLVSQVGVVMGFLSGNLQEFSQQINDVKQMHQVGLGIIKAQEEERKRVAREIHDGPAQSLANVVFRVELCEKLMDVDMVRTKEELRELKLIVKNGLQEVRRIIFDLRPMALDDLGLVPALNRFVETYQEREGIHTELTIIGKERQLHTSLEIALFRLIQESLSNIKKHAQAKEAKIRLEFAANKINVIIEDWGKGFDVEKFHQEVREQESFGLLGMQERVKLLGGEMQIKSAPGKGTRVVIIVPVPEENN